VAAPAGDTDGTTRHPWALSPVGKGRGSRQDLQAAGSSAPAPEQQEQQEQQHEAWYYEYLAPSSSHPNGDGASGMSMSMGMGLDMPALKSLLNEGLSRLVAGVKGGVSAASAASASWWALAGGTDVPVHHTLDLDLEGSAFDAEGVPLVPAPAHPHAPGAQSPAEAATAALTNEAASGADAGAASGAGGSRAAARQGLASEADDRGCQEEEEEDDDDGGFELVEACSGEGGGRVGGLGRRVQRPPLSEEEFAAMFDGEGRLVAVQAFRERVFGSGMEPGVRREAWKYLLGVYPVGSTAAERTALAVRLRKQYDVLRGQWSSIGREQAARFDKWRERCSRIDKDVRRTDRALPFFSAERGPNIRALRHILLTYGMYNFNLGYCQGMSDLASPLLYVMRDEVEAFWCFAALMDRLQGNFDSDQRSMHCQLLALRALVQVLDPQLHAHLERHEALTYFFTFRWVLIHFKREFKYEEVQRLWEAMWACPFTPHLHLYLVAAVLIHHRRAILEQDLDFDGMLKFCCELSGRLELEPLLHLAHLLVNFAGQAGRDCLRAEGMPHPPPLYGSAA